MPTATFNDTVLAESDATVVVEGNHYFPRESIAEEHFVASEKTSWCPWKGTASYFSVTAGGEESTDAAWYYPDPKAEAANIKDHVAFWGDVTVE